MTRPLPSKETKKEDPLTKKILVETRKKLGLNEVVVISILITCCLITIVALSLLIYPKNRTQLHKIAQEVLAPEPSYKKMAGINKDWPVWPVPKQLKTVRVKAADQYNLMILAALQGLVNRQAPNGTMVYLLVDNLPDEQWLNYYKEKLGIASAETSLEDLLDWARENAGLKYYIVIDPSQPNRYEPEADHSSTVNLAATMAGIFGNAVPVHPDNISLLEAHGYKLLPDFYTKRFKVSGDKLLRPNVFDLRNQWNTSSDTALWRTRQDVYRWALNNLLPLVNHHAVSFNYESGTDFAPWINDYAVGAKIFSYNLNPAPNGTTAQNNNNSEYDIYKELLEKSGPFTMIRGWNWDEGNTIKLASQTRSFHAGSKEMANATVHMALSQLFTEPFTQKEIRTEETEVNPAKIYLTFSVSDGDQFGVTYNYYLYRWSQRKNEGERVWWDDPARGQIPINWSVSGLLYDFGRGIQRYLFETATPNDYFTSDLPVGYGWFTQENFGSDLAAYLKFADDYLGKAGLPAATFMPQENQFFPISSNNIKSYVVGFKNTISLREGYLGNSYQGIYWPEGKPLQPYIRNTYAPGASGYNDQQTQSGENVAKEIEKMAASVPYRPLFMHFNWINWYENPTEMKKCLDQLNQDFPGEYQLVGLPEFIALAKKAKMTGQFPLEFLAYTGGENGLEAPYLWEDYGSTVNRLKKEGGKIDEKDYLGRSTTGNNYVVYKFNVAPAKTASLVADLEGSNFRVDVSGDNFKWQEGLISGSSKTKVSKTADLTPYLNDNGSVYVKFTGETKLYHVKVNYK